MTVETLQAENAELRRRLEEAEETIRAIQSGAVDAFVVEEPVGRRVYTLEGADRPYRLLVEQMQQGAATLQADGTIVYCNRRLADLLQVPHEKLIGATLYDFVPREERPVFDALLRQGRTATGEGETHLRETDGTLVPVFLTLNVLPQDSGAAVGVLITNLTAQKHQEKLAATLEALKISEERMREQSELLRVTLASIGDAVITTDPDGRITYLNPVAQDLTGWTQADAQGKPMTMVFHIINEETRQQAENPVERVLSMGKAVGLANHTVLIRKNGTERTIDDSAAPIRNHKGQIAGVVLIFRDITERRRAERVEGELAKLTALRADISDALATSEGQQDVLHRCTQALVGHLDMAFARIWTLNEAGNMLELQASTGQYTNLDGPHSRIKVGEYKIGRIASSRRPHRTNAVPEDPNISDPEWAKREGMVAFAGYPLLVEGRVLGVLAMFARRPLTDTVVADLGPLAESIGQYLQRRRTEVALQESEARKSAVVNTALDCIITIDHEGKVIEFNPAAERTFGYRRAEAEGREMAELIIPPSLREGHRIGLARYLASGVGPILDQRLELTAMRSDGTEFPAEVTITRINKDDPPLFTGYVRDITERKQAELALRQLAADLSEADRRKNEFLAMLAHELRNPLAPIRNALHILRLTKGNGTDIQATSEMMERQVGQMVRLVDDLLDMSRISRGKIELRRERIELTSAVNHAVEAARSLVQCMEHDLTITLPPQPLYLNADPTRLTQVVGNLLNNACKFTDKGGRISLTVERAGEQAVIRVRDSGIGIAAEELPRIFDMFTQIDTSLERSTSGLGIGLTLVKGLIEMHGGTVEVHSAGIGQGSEFVVRLPILLEAPKPPPGPAVSEPPPTTARRILVVDDNRDAAESLAMLLQLTGNETHTAYDGQEAVEAAATFRPDVILLDIGLPKLNGYEAARRIREEPWGKNMVLLALTGWGQEEDRQKSREAGFNGHLVKPVDYAALRKLLAEMQDPKS